MQDDRVTMPPDRLRLVLGAVISLGMALLIGLVFKIEDSGRWEAWTKRFEPQLAAPSFAITANRAVVEKPNPLAQQRAQAIREARSLDWSRPLRAMEAAASQDVALLSFKPDLSKGSFKLTGEARNLAALLKYHERLVNTHLLREIEWVHEIPYSHEHIDTLGFEMTGKL